MENIVIGIEGLVGAGKTSICRELLNIIPNSIVFHGGNLYRAIIYSLMKQNNEISSNMENLKNSLEEVDIKKIMDSLNIEIKIEDRETVVYANGEKIDEQELQSEKSSMAVSVAGGSANNKNLFIFAKELINNFKKDYNVILSGRALNIIYPELNYHFFITASLDERVKRKLNQYNNEIDVEVLKTHITKRDELQKQAGFYALSEKTIEIDVTDCKNALESANKLIKHIKEISGEYAHN